MTDSGVRLLALSVFKRAKLDLHAHDRPTPHGLWEDIGFYSVQDDVQSFVHSPWLVTLADAAGVDAGAVRTAILSLEVGS